MGVFTTQFIGIKTNLNTWLIVAARAHFIIDAFLTQSDNSGHNYNVWQRTIITR